MTGIRSLMVSIPARNEEQLLPRALSGVDAAIGALRGIRPSISTCLVVALDGCSDRSRDIALEHGALTVETVDRGVGAARDTAITHGLRALGAFDLATTWVASTDADTIVPANWLVRQVMWAERGTDLVIGTVEPFSVEDPSALAAWHERHQLAEGHQHVHGANLGVRASCWRDAGGFGPLTLHEDVALVARVKEATSSWVATDTTRVRTSGRSAGRADGGFAAFVTGLALAGQVSSAPPGVKVPTAG